MTKVRGFDGVPVEGALGALPVICQSGAVLQVKRPGGLVEMSESEARTLHMEGRITLFKDDHENKSTNPVFVYLPKSVAQISGNLPRYWQSFELLRRDERAIKPDASRARNTGEFQQGMLLSPNEARDLVRLLVNNFLSIMRHEWTGINYWPCEIDAVRFLRTASVHARDPNLRERVFGWLVFEKLNTGESGDEVLADASLEFVDLKAVERIKADAAELLEEWCSRHPGRSIPTPRT
jgi:hypothetical protein